MNIPIQQMPYEYVNSNVIPLAISNGDEKRLFIGVAESFCKEYLERLNYCADNKMTIQSS